MQRKMDSISTLLICRNLFPSGDCRNRRLNRKLEKSMQRFHLDKHPLELDNIDIWLRKPDIDFGNKTLNRVSRLEKVLDLYFLSHISYFARRRSGSIYGLDALDNIVWARFTYFYGWNQFFIRSSGAIHVILYKIQFYRGSIHAQNSNYAVFCDRHSMENPSIRNLNLFILSWLLPVIMFVHCQCVWNGNLHLHSQQCKHVH